MRNILFRGKDRFYDRRWYYGNLYDHDTKGRSHIYTPSMGSLNINPDTVGQYVGQTDDSLRHTKIFEGDIVSYLLNGAPTKRFVVVYSEDDAAFVLKNEKDNSLLTFAAARLLGRLKVIGNIHDNPEMLYG